MSFSSDSRAFPPFFLTIGGDESRFRAGVMSTPDLCFLHLEILFDEFTTKLRIDKQ
jgi:hypothetical protein